MNSVIVFVLTIVTIMTFSSSVSATESKKVHYIHWNRASPLFRIDNTDHIVDVKEHDQANIICPVSKPGQTDNGERHVIYSVSKEEYESCRITNPRPRVIAVCNRPHRLMYFTITFRSFTPTPGGLEFHPGQDYYFISTSSRTDLHRRVGGGCSTHNMKMIFKVHDSEEQKRLREEQEAQRLAEEEELRRVVEEQKEDLLALNIIEDVRQIEKKVQKTTTEKPLPSFYYNRDRDVYYYHPRDVLSSNRLNSGKTRENRSYLRLTAESSAASVTSSYVIMATLLSAFLTKFCMF